jgi:hypothetical protein
MPPAEFNDFIFQEPAPSEEHDNEINKIIKIDCSETLKWLEDSGISCPRADQQLMNNLIQFMIEIGYMPEPNKYKSKVNEVSTI